MLTHARDVAADSVLTADVCIVGAGPAGIAISLALIGSGLSVLLLESGGLMPSVRAQRLYSGRVVGHDYFRLDGCRYRLFGGATNRWGGWSRPLEPVDFTERSWIPESGWPIGTPQLQQYYPRTAELMELSTPRFDLDHWLTLLPHPLSLPPTADFESIVFQYSPQTNFGTRYLAEITQAENVRAVLEATVVDLRMGENSQRLDEVSVRSFNGNRFTVRPRAVILAAGGLENPRLLLTARSDRPNGLGNEHDNVGRYFMEHLHVPAGHLVAGAAAKPEAIDFYRRATRHGVRTRGVLTPSAEAQAAQGLAACSIAIEDESYGFGTPYVGWNPRFTLPTVRLIRSGTDKRSGAVARRFRDKAELAYNRQKEIITGLDARRARRGAPAAAGRRMHSLYFRTEQYPNRSSRVRLSPDRDEFGTQRVELDWKVTQSDLDLVPAWLRRFGEDCRASGVGEVLMPDDRWRDHVIGGPHHIGTTRMSADPRTGVVDANCRVHSVANLYVAGSSVFATGGYANPTFTLISLALRLADHLRGELATG